MMMLYPRFSIGICLRKILTMIYTTYEYGTVVSNPSNHFGWCESRWWPACGFRLAIRLQLAKRSRTQSTFMFRICPSSPNSRPNPTTLLCLATVDYSYDIVQSNLRHSGLDMDKMDNRGNWIVDLLPKDKSFVAMENLQETNWQTRDTLWWMIC